MRDRAKPDDNARYLAQWQAEVRVVMEKSAHRHTWIASVTRILHYCEAAGLFDSNESFCPVAAAPRQYDTGDARAVYARRRPEERIGGRPRVMFLRRFGAKPDKKIVDRSSGKSEFMEDTVHGNSDGMVVGVDRFWVVRAAGWAEWLSGGEKGFDGFVSENEQRGHRPQTGW